MNQLFRKCLWIVLLLTLKLVVCEFELNYLKDESVFSRPNDNNDHFNRRQLRDRNFYEPQSLVLEELIPEEAINKYFEYNLTVGIWTETIGQAPFTPVNSLYSDWNNFTYSLQNRTLVNYAKAAYSISLDSAGPVFSCADGDTVQTLWTALASRVEVDIECNQVYWKSEACTNGQVVMCANCSSPCKSLQDNIFGFQTAAVNKTFPQWSQQVFALEFNVTIDYTVTNFGTLTCAALPYGQVLSSVLGIAYAKNSLSKSITQPVNLTGTMTISGLAPDAAYTVYCFTKNLDDSSFEQSISPIALSIARAQTITTGNAPIPVFTAGFSSTSLVKNASPAVVPVSFPYKPDQNISLIPQISFLGSDLCPSNAYSSNYRSDIIGSSLLNGTDGTYSLAPLLLRFNDEFNLQKNFYIQTNQVGCYRIRFYISTDITLSSPVQANFNVKSKLFPAARVNQVFINSTASAIPSNVFIQSVQFTSSQGLIAVMQFSDDTDEGGNVKYRLNFPCAEILSFKTSNRSVCRFASASQIKIFPATSGSNLLMPGDSVTVLPGKLRAKCVYNNDLVCASQPYLSLPAQVVTVSSAIAANAVINAPSIITTASNLTFDITLSSGGGGRVWSSVKWEVLYNGQKTVHSSSIESYMNTQLQWFNCRIATTSCDTVPYFLLYVPGYYTFRLSLTNFIGMSAKTSAKILVKDQIFVPTVRLLTSNIGTTWQNRSLTVRSIVEVGNYQCPKPISISWLVFRGNAVDDSLVTNTKINRDTRSYIVGAFTLRPAEEYRFRITVFCGNYYSFDEATYYVVPSITVPAFTSGNSVTMPPTLPFVFDVSQSYAQTPKGLKGLSFQWNCVQVNPVSSAGCSKFLSGQQRNASGATLTIANPAAVFDLSKTYVVSVSVISAVQRTCFTAYQTVTITSTSSQNVPIVRAVPPAQFTVNNSFGYQIDAVVSGTSTYAAVWTLVTTNVTLSAMTFSNGGVQNFPVVIPGNLLSSRLSYTFSLSAFAVTDSCSSLACASVVSRSSFLIAVNQPPSNGFVNTLPTSGTEDTVFSIFAQNWQDDNLPLFFAFYQSYYRNSGFNMIRNRMQINYMTGKLSAPVPGSNNTVYVQGEISDYFGATNTGSVVVRVEAHEVNVSRVLQDTRLAMTTIVYLKNPEIILPVACEIVNAMHALNCTTVTNQTQTGQCDDLVSAGTYGLEKSLDFYNTGATLVNGLSAYTNSLSEANQVTVVSAFRSLLSLYQYLNTAIQATGLSRFTASQLVESMIQTADEMVNMYKDALNDATTSSEDLEWLKSSIEWLTGDENGNDDSNEDILDWLQSTVNQLSSNFFSVLPFGVTQSFTTSNHFNVTMTRSYYGESDQTGVKRSNMLSYLTPAEIEKVGTVIQDVMFESVLFQANKTSSYSYLNSLSILPVSTLPSSASSPSKHGTLDVGKKDTTSSSSLNPYERYETRYLSLNANTDIPPNRGLNATLFLRAVNVSDSVFLYYMQQNSLDKPVRSSAVVKYHYCNDSMTVPDITCSEDETNGVVHNFRHATCLNTSTILQFTCPLYYLKIQCLNNSAPVSSGRVVDYSVGSLQTVVRCDIPVLTGSAVAVAASNIQSSSGQSGGGLSMSGTFSFSISGSLSSHASVVKIHTPIDEIDDPTVRKTITIVAVIALLFAAGFFAYTLLYRVKMLVDSPLDATRNPILGRGGFRSLTPRTPYATTDTNSESEADSTIEKGSTVSDDIIDFSVGGDEADVENQSPGKTGGRSNNNSHNLDSLMRAVQLREEFVQALEL